MKRSNFFERPGRAALVFLMIIAAAVFLMPQRVLADEVLDESTVAVDGAAAKTTVKKETSKANSSSAKKKTSDSAVKKTQIRPAQVKSVRVKSYSRKSTQYRDIVVSWGAVKNATSYKIIYSYSGKKGTYKTLAKGIRGTRTKKLKVRRKKDICIRVSAWNRAVCGQYSNVIKVKNMAAAVIMPNLKGLTRAQAQAALKKAGLKKPAYRVEYYTKAKYKKEYPGMKYRRCIKQNAAAGELVDKSRKIIVTVSGKTLETGKGLEAMVRWAETVSNDGRFGYSLGVHIGKKADRFCPFCKVGATMDYDCASFTNAALAHAGMGKAFEDRCSGYAPVVGQLADMLLKNNWKRVYTKKKVSYKQKVKYYVKEKKDGKIVKTAKYKYVTKIKTVNRRPSISKLKRGDILVNRKTHVEIYRGNRQDVGAHWNYDGETGDSDGREIRYSPTCDFNYKEVYRYKG